MLVGVFLLIFISLLGYSFAADFYTQGGDDFDSGTYDQTEYNASFVQLSVNDSNGSNSAFYSDGTYESVIYDAGFYAIWSNFSWYEENESGTSLSAQIRASNDNFDMGDYVDSDETNLNGRYFQYKFSFGTDDLNVSPKLYNVSMSAEILNSSITVSLTTPDDGEEYTDTNNVTFEYNVESVLDVASCDLIVDNDIKDTNESINLGINSFFYGNMNNGNYTWSVSCIDVNDVTGEDGPYDLEIAYEEIECSDDSDCDSGEECVNNECVAEDDDPPSNTPSTTTTNTNTPSYNYRTSSSDDLINESDNSTDENVTIPSFETRTTEGGLFGNVATGFSFMGDRFGNFAGDNLISVLLLGLMVGFIVSRTIFGMKLGVNYTKPKKKKNLKSKKNTVSSLFKKK